MLEEFRIQNCEINDEGGAAGVFADSGNGSFRRQVNNRCAGRDFGVGRQAAGFSAAAGTSDILSVLNGKLGDSESK